MSEEGAQPSVDNGSQQGPEMSSGELYRASLGAPLFDPWSRMRPLKSTYYWVAMNADVLVDERTLAQYTSKPLRRAQRTTRAVSEVEKHMYRFLLTVLLSGQHDFVSLLADAPPMYSAPIVTITQPTSDYDLITALQIPPHVHEWHHDWYRSLAVRGYDTLAISNLPDPALIFGAAKKEKPVEYLFACLQLWKAVLLTGQHFKEWIHFQFADGWDMTARLASAAVWLLVPERREEWYLKAFKYHSSVAEDALAYGKIMSKLKRRVGYGGLLLLACLGTRLMDIIDDWKSVNAALLKLNLSRLFQPLTDILLGRLELQDIGLFDNRENTLEEYFQKLGRVPSPRIKAE